MHKNKTNKTKTLQHTTMITKIQSEMKILHVVFLLWLEYILS